jgi:hypothetical protein
MYSKLLGRLASNATLRIPPERRLRLALDALRHTLTQ